MFHFSRLMRAAVLAGAMSGMMGTAGLAMAQTASPGPANLETLPRWSEFPAPPENVPSAADIRLKVNTMAGKGRQLRANASTIVWDNYAPDQLAAQFNKLVESRYLVTVDPELTPAQLDAFAASLRAKAVPPPVAQ